MICQKCGLESETLSTEKICPDCVLSPAPPPAASGVIARRDVAAVAMSQQGVELRSLDDLARFSKMVFDSGLAPAGMKSAAAVAVAVQAGMELNFSPLRALSAVFVVNGRPRLMGEAALGKIRSSGLLKRGTDIETGVVGAGDERVGFVRSHRQGAPASIERTFTVPEAKAAGKWGTTGPWTSDPGMMLIWRAVGRTAKLDWSDVLLGLELAEVAMDYENLDGPPRARVLEPPGVDPALEGA